MSKITYKDEIIDELTKEFGIDRKQMEEICNLNIEYIQTLVKTPEVISIVLPNLGVLHFNATKARYSYKNSNTYRKYVDAVTSQLKLVDSLYKTKKDLVHRRKSYYSMVRKYFFKDREARKKSTKLEVFEKMEVKQNKVIK